MDSKTLLLKSVASSLGSAVERRLFAEYGAIFVTTATPPPGIVFAGAAEVESFQASLPVARERMGDHDISLQTPAMDALIRAAARMNDLGGEITARADDSGGRSYQDTVNLWNRNVARGLEHWQEQRRISSDQAAAVRSLPPVEQVGVILDLEERDQLYFGTFFDKSILYSVAAPGASQHLSLLAFDVAEYQSRDVEDVLAEYGWFRTVPNDLPHFTYLGHDKEALPNMGLVNVDRKYGARDYTFWIPDVARLR